MEYNFREIEKKWQKRWVEEKTYQVTEDESKQKFYVLNMFPYPSGAGLHVGHPLGYIASDIYARYKRLQGFNVLNPMGYDAYGLPAEQYAIQTGQHPAITTINNIDRYREQLDKIGFSFDWNREIRTCDPEYYHWTQWAFLKMFNSYYCNDRQQACPIEELIKAFDKNGTEGLNVACSEELRFTADEWKAMDEKKQQETLMNYRIAYLGETMVNWCPKLGTVLANDEVVNGVSERGGYPVEQKIMRQWCLRVSAYAQRLLDGLETIDWTDSLKETQRNWIGRSEGAEIQFKVKDSDLEFTIFTTRADTMFGVTFMVLAPESELVAQLTTPEQKQEVDAYLDRTKKRTERERIADRSVTGVFSGSYAINPFTGDAVPVWISDYVLAGYGTGAIMAVPAHDDRDWEFAKKFGCEIIEVVSGGEDVQKAAFTAKDETGILVNSDFLNGKTVKDAIPAMIEWLCEKGIGHAKVQYKLRDWVFSRQRYWGEPIPIIHCPKCGNVPVPEEELPLRLPEVESYEPTGTGESPLAAIDEWVNCKCPQCGADAKRETNTMPQWAGSSWYFLRYVDNHNDKELVSREKADEMLPVDMYIGGVEHAVLHLLYSRFYTKFLNDIGVVDFDEPFHKLFNQGMITGKNGIKMSKSKGNVVSPDDLVRDYGCDSLRMYELFVGPPELDAEWDDRGIDGVNRFLKRLWNLVMDSKDSDVKASKEMIKERHKLVYDVTTRLESFSLNTVISAFMEHNNKLIEIAKKEGGIDKETLSTVAVLLSPFAPHVAEELWEQLGHEGSVFKAGWPTYDENEMKDDEIQVPVQINGKTKAVISVPTDISKDDAIAAGKEAIADKLTGNIVKEIYVPKKIINIVMK